ncbi:ankyrin repeat domain-containing protein, partial [bacterium]
GGDADEVTCNGRNPLAEAAGSGDPARVRLLLENGASPHPPESTFGKDDYEDEVALLADWGDDTPQMLAELRERLASTPPGYPSFAVPLFQAAEGGSAESVRLLLEAGASTDLRDRDGRSALDHAANAEIARVLLAAGLAPLDRQTWLDALEDERFQFAKALLEGGLDPNGVEDSWSLLHHTAFRLHPKGIRLLARYGVDLTFRTPDGESPLHGAAWQGDGNMGIEVERNEATIRALVELGFDVNERDINGQTPLHEAAYGDWGSPTAIRTLLELGALPDPVDHNGVTPLMQAAYHGEEECVRLLLEAGADPRRPAKDRTTALGVAEEHVRVWRGLSEKAVVAQDQDDIQMAEEALAKAERSLSALQSH